MYACRKRLKCNFIKVNYFCFFPHQLHICQQSLHHQSGKMLKKGKIFSSSNIYYEMIYIRIFCGFWNKYINCAFENILWSSCLHAMASAPPCPAWSLEGGHPLRPSLLFHLRLHPHCHLPPPCCVSCRWGDRAHPAPFFKCLALIQGFGQCKIKTYEPSNWPANKDRKSVV